MLDMVNALVLGAVLAANIAVYSGFPRVSPAARWWTASLLAVWATLIVAGAALGRFSAHSSGVVVAPPVVFGAVAIALLTAWLSFPAFRGALLSIPMYALIGLNGLRVLGVFFVLMYAAHRLPFPFAPFAGWGDILTGLIAIPLAIYAARGTVNNARIALWNAFGALDLFTALTLGALSADNTPIRVFTDAPGMDAITQLPDVLIPTMFVPLYLLSHLVIATALRKPRSDAREQNRSALVEAAST